MEYRKENLGSYNLHMIKNDNFRTITIKVILREKIERENITKRMFLSHMLSFSTKEYNTKRKLALKCQDLYGVNVGITNARLGNYLNSTFTLSLLDEKYTEANMLDESIKFLNEIIFNPNQENGSFDETSFDIIKTQMEIGINGVKENTKAYSLIRMLENMDSNSPISYHVFGYLDDLNKITPSNLYEYYKNMLKTNLVDIYVLGNIDYDRTLKLVKENFSFRTFRNERIASVIPYKEGPKTPNLIIESEPVKQSKLAIGCRLVDLTDYERNYVLTLYSIILGGGSDSKLFKTVREEKSLAYYVFSIANKLDNVLIIQSGIARENLDITVKTIKKQLKAMIKGEFSDEDIDIAKKLFTTSLKEINDSPKQIIESYYSMELLGMDDVETRLKKMLEVTREEIMAVSKKVKIDTIYLLEGSESDEKN